MTGTGGGRAALPYWQLKALSAKFHREEERTALARDTHRRFAGQAQRRGHRRDEHDARLRLAEWHLLDNDGVSALREARLAAKAERSDAAARVERRARVLRRGDARRVKQLHQAEPGSPDFEEAARALLESARSDNDAEAEATARRLLAEHHDAVARRLGNEGEFAAALASAERASELAPTKARHEGVAQFRDDVDLYERLLPALARLGDHGTYLRVGKDHRSRGELPAARVIYLAGQIHFPAEPKLFNAIGGALREMGERDLAREQAERSLQLEPSLKWNRAGHTLRGHLLCDERRFSEGLRAGQELAKVHPDDGMIDLLIVHAACGARRYDLAIHHARRAEANPKLETDVVTWLCSERAGVAANGDDERLRAFDEIIDYLKRQRGEPIWAGSTALTNRQQGG